MTMPDLPERAGPSDTRQMAEAERRRIIESARVGNRSFAIALAIIVVGGVLALLLLR